MSSVTLHDKTFVPYISNAEIQAAIEKVAEQIKNDLAGTEPLFLGVLNGSFRFASDLMSRIDMNCHVSFVKVASYSGTETKGNVRQLIGLGESLKGRTIVVIEDIVDRGHTIANIMELIQAQGPKEVKVCTCLFKPSAYEKDIPIDYAAIEIENDFVVGYGLDYDGLGRNLNDLYQLEQ